MSFSGRPNGTVVFVINLSCKNMENKTGINYLIKNVYVNYNNNKKYGDVNYSVAKLFCSKQFYITVW